MSDNKRFLEFAESLKLVRKNRLEDYIQKKDIDDIYTDLLPNNGIITKLNLPRTTILVGRKGTGKSTIFKKSQKDLISNKKCISIYIDVKTLFDNSTPDIPEEVKSLGPELNKYLIYSNLIKEIIIETKNQLNDFIDASIFQKILGYDHNQILQINEQLDAIENSINDVIKQIDGSLINSYKIEKSSNITEDARVSLKLSETSGIEISDKNSTSENLKSHFEKTLITYLDIKKSLISKLKAIKDILDIDHLYIFLDDFSEIDENAQKIFVEWFIAPLNNLSEDFVKFKIAVYPNRFYYGKLDNGKIDEISLEFFDAFYTFEKQADINKMEMLALDYTKRLIKKRLEIFFPENNWERFFDIKLDDLYDLLFSVSFNNPRKIGYILSYCYESCLIHNTKISKEAIEKASNRYFNEVTLKYFLANQYVSKPFNDKLSNELQFELLNNIINRQINNNKSLRSRILTGKPTNHFIINEEISYLLDNLELNGFLTTYNKVNDNHKQLSVVYSLDYGLCKKHGLNFLRAKNEKIMKYFSHPLFNMNVLISEYFNKTQLIKCQNGHEFPYEMLPTLKRYKMRCPDCMDNNQIGACEVTVSNEEIREKLNSIELNRLKSFSVEEFLVLDALNSINTAISLQKISNILDKSDNSLKNIIKKLIEKDFVTYDFEAGKTLNKDLYILTAKGKTFTKRLIEEIKKRSFKGEF